MSWYVTLNGKPIVDAVTETPLMELEESLQFSQEMRMLHPLEEVLLWEGKKVGA